MFVLYLIVFVGLTGVGIIIPLFPFFGEQVGATPAQITMLMALFAAGQFVASPFWGWLSDRIGRRPVFIFTLAGGAASYVILGMAETVPALYLARVFGGLMAGNVPVAFAAAADMSGGEDRSKVMGRIGASFSLGFILGPAIGGFLAGSDPQETNFLLIAMAAGGMSLLALLLSILVFKESHPPSKRNSRPLDFGSSAIRRSFRFFGMPVIGALIVMNFIFIAAGSIIDSTFALYANKAHDLGPNAIGYLFTYMGVIMAGVQGGAIGPLTSRFGDIFVAQAGVALYLVGVALLIPASTFFGLLFALTFLTTGVSLFVPSTSSLVSQNAPDSEQGAALGVFQAAGNLGRVVTPMFSGVIFSAYGVTAPFYIAILFLLPALWLAQKTRSGIRTT